DGGHAIGHGAQCFPHQQRAAQRPAPVQQGAAAILRVDDGAWRLADGWGHAVAGIERLRWHEDTGNGRWPSGSRAAMAEAACHAFTMTQPVPITASYAARIAFMVELAE